jgi:hypothetical protein
MAARAHEKDAKDQESVLPPGQRDRSGFWYPAGYADPQTLVRRRLRRGNAPASRAEAPEDLTDPS